MRQSVASKGMTVNAIAGTHVVLLGFDLTDAARAGCLGFALHREDVTENEAYWLRGSKTFAATDPGLPPGGSASSHDHPFQSFQWADYSAKPDHQYRYNVIALGGTPDQLTDQIEVTVQVDTEPELGQTHSVFFNRGSLATQEYARRFLNIKPSKLAPDKQAAAYSWLSRGLFEAFEAFVGRALDNNYELHAALYEVRWEGAVDCFKRARDRGAIVQIVYDDISTEGPGTANAAAIALAGLTDVSTARTRGKIMHNKFVVLSHQQQPIAVWTGSTNLSENGIYGHANCGHIIEDAAIAAQYLDYFNELSTNPVAATERAWMTAHNPRPPQPWNSPVTEVFSPHSGLDVLKWYARIAGGAINGLFMTFAFGMDDLFKQVYEHEDDILKFALMEKEGNGAGLAQGKKDIRRIRKRENVVVAIGNRIVTNSFDRWLAESSGLGNNVHWIHTKYMLVDPLGPAPIVITGSANFSEPSTNENNENMLVIVDDQRVADIYLGEFMRLYSHYAFREAVKIAEENNEEWNPKNLIPDASWQDLYYQPGDRQSRRKYFAGT
jgi:hypothetical protein